jgi:hypothetical protein
MRSRIVACIALLSLAGPSYLGYVQAQTGTTPLSRNEHPRLGMNRSDLPAIVARLSSGGEWQSDFQSYVNYIDSVWSSSSSGFEDLAMWSMGAAFIYSVRTQGNCCTGITFPKTTAQYASQALAWATKLRNLDATPPNYLVEHAYHSTFFVYDWIHDTLSATTKAGFIDYWRSLDTYAPIITALQSTPQWSNEQHSRGFARKMLAGLACYGDGIDDLWCQSSYQTYPSFIRNATNGMVTRETQRGGTDSSWIQGINYGLSYDAHHLAIAEMGWRTANGISKGAHYTAADAGYWLGLGRLATYFQRPWAAPSANEPDGRHWRFLKDVYTNRDFTPQEGAEDLVWWGLMRRELQGVDDDAASLAAWTIAHRAYAGGKDPRYWVHTKFLGAKNAERGPSAIGLPLAKAFRFGSWMWRSGWDNINDALVTVFGYEFTGFRSAVGSFSIDYMGPSIIVPGSGGHDFDAAWHGFANSLGAPENRSTPETTDPENYDDYGYHRAYNPITPNFVQNTAADWLDRTERFVGPDATSDFGYLRVDRSRSMNGVLFSDTASVGSAPKVASAQREFAVFLPATPGTDSLRVVVSDRMTTLDTRFEKRWTLYYSGTPVVNGSASAGPARGNPSSSAGKTTYSGTTLITAVSGDTTANNKVWVRPIFPRNSRVVLVNFRRNNEVEDPYGLMHPTSGFSVDDTGYVGSYRTEIIPTTGQLSDHFVNTVEVTTANGAASTTEAIDGTNYKGARVGDRIAVFGAADLAPAGTFVIPSPGRYRVLVSDMGSGASRTITGGANISSITDVAAQTASPFTANAYGLVYLDIVVGGTGTGASNTVSIGAPVGGAPEPTGVPPTSIAPQAPTTVRIIR